LIKIKHVLWRNGYEVHVRQGTQNVGFDGTRKWAGRVLVVSASPLASEYRTDWLPGDIVAGVTLAAYAIPVSLAYAGLAGLPPQVGVYGYLLGGLGYALLGSSRQLAIGPTSAISLMIAGTVGAMAEE
jgi:MFS superfamily sulfate permease-like transporter